MTLLHVMGSSSDGGAETHFLHLLDALSDEGIRQAAALRRHAGREAALAARSIPAAVFPFRRVDPVTRFRIAAMARRLEARVLLAWMSRSAANLPRGPWRRVGRLGGYYGLRFFRGCDLLVANTADIHAYILREGWPADRATIIGNFAEVDSCPALPRSSFGTPTGVPILLSMGRLHEEKGHDVTLRALADLPEAVLWLAGSGPAEAELKRLASQLGVAGRVRFLGWREDAGALYRAADICLFPSRAEPLGNVVIQCWAYGLPVVAARAIGPQTLIRPEEDGLLVPLEDAAALAAATRRLLADDALRQRFREAGLARATAEFAKPAVVARWRAVLGV